MEIVTQTFVQGGISCFFCTVLFYTLQCSIILKIKYIFYIYKYIGKPFKIGEKEQDFDYTLYQYMPI